jgi:hypothetical protein
MIVLSNHFFLFLLVLIGPKECFTAAISYEYLINQVKLPEGGKHVIENLALKLANKYVSRGIFTNLSEDDLISIISKCPYIQVRDHSLLACKLTLSSRFGTYETPCIPIVMFYSLIETNSLQKVSRKSNILY